MTYTAICPCCRRQLEGNALAAWDREPTAEEVNAAWITLGRPGKLIVSMKLAKWLQGKVEDFAGMECLEVPIDRGEGPGIWMRKPVTSVEVHLK